MNHPLGLLIPVIALLSCASPMSEKSDSPPTPTPVPTPTPTPTPEPVSQNPDHMVGTWIANEDYEVDDGVGYVMKGTVLSPAQENGVVPGQNSSKILTTRIVFNANGTGYIDSIRQTQVYHLPTNPNLPSYYNEENVKVDGQFEGQFPMWYEKSATDFTWTYVDGILAIKGFQTGGYGLLPSTANPDSFVESNLVFGGVAEGVTVQLNEYHVSLSWSLQPGDWHNTVKTPRPGIEGFYIFDISGAFTVTGSTATTELLSFFTRTTMTFVRQ